LNSPANEKDLLNLYHILANEAKLSCTLHQLPDYRFVSIRIKKATNPNLPKHRVCRSGLSYGVISVSGSGF
jgi:hypothetical protein